MDPTSFFDVLEPRALLSAPVATVQSFALTGVTMTVVVSYASDTGIDRASIGVNDVGVTGPGVSHFAESAAIVAEGPTETVVRYLIRSTPPGFGPYYLWPNGTYNLGIPAGTVRSTDGMGIADTGAGSHWVWFPDLYPELLPWEPNDVSARLILWPHYFPNGSMQVAVRLTFPDGSQQVRTATIDRDHYGFFNFEKPGGRPWDYTDRGTFTYEIGEYDGAQYNYRPGAQRWLWFNNPKLEILSTDVTDTGARITIHITGANAIDTTWFSGEDLYVSVEGWEVPPSRDGPNIISDPVVEPQADGSVIATYWRAEPGGRFTNRDTGEWVYYSGQLGRGTRVRDVAGNYANYGVLRRETHVFSTIGTWTVGLTAHANDPSFLRLAVPFFNDYVDLGTFGDGDVRLELNGQTYQLSLIAVQPDPNPGFYVGYYALQLPQGQRLQTGTGNFYLNAGALTTSGLPNPEAFLGQFWFWFN